MFLERGLPAWRCNIFGFAGSVAVGAGAGSGVAAAGFSVAAGAVAAGTALAGLAIFSAAIATVVHPSMLNRTTVDPANIFMPPPEW